MSAQTFAAAVASRIRKTPLEKKAAGTKGGETPLAVMQWLDSREADSPASARHGRNGSSR